MAVFDSHFLGRGKNALKISSGAQKGSASASGCGKIQKVRDNQTTALEMEHHEYENQQTVIGMA